MEVDRICTWFYLGSLAQQVKVKRWFWRNSNLDYDSLSTIDEMNTSNIMVNEIKLFDEVLLILFLCSDRV